LFRKVLLGGAALCLAVFVACFLAFVFRAQIFTALGSYLVLNQTPEKADAVVALAGDDYGGRVLTAGQLVKEGWAPYALISGTPYLLTNHAELSINFAVAHGYPRSYFRPFERDMVATRDETADIATQLKHDGVHKILLVSSNYHTRRAAQLMRKAAPGLQVISVAAPDKYFTPDGWWRNRGGQRTFLQEWLKTFSAWIGN
jgi:uncharacterized SAM-binding protein YcdF (DUF218 family)